MLKCLVCSHVDNIKESSNNEGKKGKKISLYYRLKCNKLRGVLRSLMETAPIYTRSESLFTGIFVPFQAHRLNSTIDPIRLLA